jgi:hypothetical protein
MLASSIAARGIIHRLRNRHRLSNRAEMITGFVLRAAAPNDYLQNFPGAAAKPPAQSGDREVEIDFSIEAFLGYSAK